MKTLKDNVILYDEDCPLCRMYTGAFVRYGLLEKNGRISFSEIGPDIRNLIDYTRSKNEIALVNVASRKVLYGLDSLITILENRVWVLKYVLRFPLFYYILKAMYAFVSYNRKVIVPSAAKADGNACVPTLHRGYRIAYIVVFSMLTAWLSAFYLNNVSWVKSPWPLEYLLPLLHIAQFAICGSYVYLLNKEKIWDYLGNVTTTTFLGTLPLILVYYLVPVSSLLYDYALAPVYLFMLFEHHRRVKLIGLDITVTGVWVLFRVFILGVYFLFFV